MTTKYEALGKQIYQWRMAIGMAKQTELAQQLKISQQTVSRWEAGSSRPRANELLNLAAALKIDVQELSQAAGYAPRLTPTVSFDRPLPLPSLLPDSFEYFCLDLLSTHFQEKADVHLSGKTGHKQFGIDIEAVFTNGDLYTYQCKREAQFGPEKVKTAIKAQSIKAKKKHILLSRVASPEARLEIKRVAGWALWDQVDITRIFRTLPKQEQVRIVDIYFPTQRHALTGELAAGPWQTVATFFAPQLVEGRVFNQSWEIVGRDRELDEIDKAFADRSILAISLVGRAGEGKSRVLRAALDAFATNCPSTRVFVASPTEEITAKSLEDLGLGEKLLVVDDVHDRSDLVQLIRYTAESRSQARLLLVYRPYWTDVVHRELGRCGLIGTLAKSITLSKPTKEDGINLASQVLAKNGAPQGAARLIASMAYDSPLAVVVGAQIVAKEGVHPELFGSNEAFRTTVLNHYLNIIAQGIGQGKDQERLHAILRTLALIQPFVPDDKQVLLLLNCVENIETSDASRLLRLLVDAGVLFKRGSGYRLSPDLLADSIIESTCINLSGTSNGHAEKVFHACIPEHKEHVLLNLGRLDWRRNKGDTSASTLLDGLWSMLTWEDDYVNAQVKAAATASYYQPRQAIVLAQRLIDAGHGQDEDVCRIVLGASYHVNYLTDACALLWEAGQHDARPTNQHPYHAIRLLTELATPEPWKPAEFIEGVVDFALSLLDYPNTLSGPYTPFDILNGALATGGHYTSSSTSRNITISTYAVQIDRVKQVRHRIIAELLASLSNANLRRAFLAAQHLDDALRGPIAAQPNVTDTWGEEFRETLEKIDALLGSLVVPAAVLIRVAQSVTWHAFYGPDRTQPPALKILARLNRDLGTRTIRALMDAWGSNTWPIEETGGRTQHDRDVDSLCRDLASQYPEPAQLANFVHDRLEDIANATGSADYGPVQLFLGRLLNANVPLAWHLMQSYLCGDNTRLTPHAGLAMGVLLTRARVEASALIKKVLAKSDLHLRILAQGYFYASDIAPYSEHDLATLKRVFASRKKDTLWCIPRIMHDVAKYDKHMAIELLMAVDVESALLYAREIFMWVAHEETTPFDLIRDDQLDKLIAGMRHADRLDDHWVNAFLKKAIRRVPGSILDLAMARIDDAIASENWHKHPLGDVLHDSSALDLMALPAGPQHLRALLDWALVRIENYTFRYRFAELVQSLCRPYGPPLVSVLENWLAGGTADHVKVVSVILHDAGPRFIYANERFLAQTLKAARGISIKAHKELSSAAFAASVGGVRSGTPGQPFDVDLELQAMAERRLTLLAKSDSAYGLYKRIRDYATHEIERQVEEGRRMDDVDSDA